MIDVHHHLLYGLDDGPDTIEESMAMAKMADENGITHIVCTPHANSRYAFSPEENASRLARLREELAKLGSPIILGQGCDFHLNWDNIEDARKHPAKYSINGKRYLLVELPDNFIPGSLTNTLAELQLSGIVPIVTHPERNSAIKRDPARLKPWLENGALIQVTAGAILGKFGSTSKALTERFISDDWVHLIATDAHNVSKRPPLMRAAYDRIVQGWGGETADRLCVVNPRAVFDGERLALQPYPAGVGEDQPAPRPRTLLQTFFGRL